jgi:hypothetical protein
LHSLHIEAFLLGILRKEVWGLVCVGKLGFDLQHLAAPCLQQVIEKELEKCALVLIVNR